MKTLRRRRSGEFKARLTLEILTGQRTLDKIASESSVCSFQFIHLLLITWVTITWVTIR
jgi:transposase-like protein